MNQYNKESSCPKCGEQGAESKYDSGQPTTRFISIFGFPPDDFVPEESIIRTCKNCSYKWFEEPNTSK